MTQVLTDVRVLDLTRGPAGGLATMILADFGADVIVVERPEHDPLADLAAAPMWRRGKSMLPLDLDAAEDADTFEALCAAADVLVCNWRASAMARKGLDYESLHTRHKHLILCHISGFGSHGPRADYPGYEHVVAAYTGRMRVFSGIADRPGPVFSALQVGIHACAQSATAGILAALFQRGNDGEGRLVETSMLQGMLPYEQGAMLATQFRERFSDILSVFQPASDELPPPSLYYHPAQAGDGRWMQFGNLLPHLFDNFLLATDLIDIVADPEFDPAQLLLPPAKQEAFRERMLLRIQQRPAADWMTDFIANGGVVATTYQTSQEALADPDVVANGHVIERGEGVQLGPVARLVATPAEPGGGARYDASRVDQWCRSPRPAPVRQGQGLPLAGVRVIEIATIIAAPMGASLLADMGADVVKVEQIGGDPYRGLGAGIGSARVNAGKRSLSIDLKSDAGREIVLELIGDADVLIHNFRPGVPERLGIGYEQCAARNPDIIYLQSNGYGPDGPGAPRPSTHPIPGAAMGGVLFQLGERIPEELQNMDGLRLWTRRLMRANEVNPDPNTALVVVTSVMLGLVARARCGTGQQILIDMFGANAYANHDDFLNYPGKPKRALPDPDLLGLSATYRLYRCANDQWVFLGLTDPRERGRLVEALRGAGFDAPASDALAAGGEGAADALAQIFAAKEATYWESTLTAAGIGCVRADDTLPSQFWLDDPQAIALGLTSEVEHPRWGRYRRHGPMVFFDRTRPQLKPPPLAGQHNHEVLLGLGYSDQQIAKLEDDNVLWQEPVELEIRHDP